MRHFCSYKAEMNHLVLEVRIVGRLLNDVFSLHCQLINKCCWMNSAPHKGFKFRVPRKSCSTLWFGRWEVIPLWEYLTQSFRFCFQWTFGYYVCAQWMKTWECVSGIWGTSSCLDTRSSSLPSQLFGIQQFLNPYMTIWLENLSKPWKPICRKLKWPAF